MSLAEHLAYYTRTVEGQLAGLGAAGTIAEAVATNPCLNHKALPYIMVSKNLRKKFFEQGPVYWLTDYLDFEKLTNAEKIAVVKAGSDPEVWKKVCSTLWTPSLENWTAAQIAENLLFVDDEMVEILNTQAVSKLRLYIGLKQNNGGFTDKDKEAIKTLVNADHKRVPSQLIRAYLSAVPEAQVWAADNLNEGRMGQILCGVPGLKPETFEKILKWVKTAEGDTKKYSLAALYYNPWSDQKYLVDNYETLGFEDMSEGQHGRWYARMFPEDNLDLNRLLHWAKPSDYRPGGRPEAFWALHSTFQSCIDDYKDEFVEFLNVLSERYISGFYTAGAELLAGLAQTEHSFIVTPGVKRHADDYDMFSRPEPNLSWAIGGSNYTYIAQAIDSQHISEEHWSGIYAICDSLAPQTSITTLLQVAKNLASQ